jgi:hypothetical protein
MRFGQRWSFELEERWQDDWAIMMDGKRALGEFAGRTQFRNTSAFVDALGATLRDVPSVVPPAIDELRQRLHGLIRGE